MKLLTSILTTLALSATLTFAEEGKPPGGPGKPGGPEGKRPDPEKVFKKLDSNNDGSVSLDEFKAGPMGKKDPAKAEEIFKKKDKDSDGKLSLDEFKAHGPGGKPPKGDKKKDA